MKKIFATIFAGVLMLIGTQAYAQLAVNAGYLNVTEKSDFNASVAGIDLGTSGSFQWNGAYVGVDYNIGIGAPGLSVAPGINLQMLFASEDKTSYNELDVVVPVDLRYSLELASDMKLFAFAGPRCQLGLTRTSKYDGGDSKNVYDDENWKKFNLLAGGGIGAELGNQLRITLGYDHTIMSMYDHDNIKVNRGQIKIGVGYLF